MAGNASVVQRLSSAFMMSEGSNASDPGGMSILGQMLLDEGKPSSGNNNSCNSNNNKNNNHNNNTTQSVLEPKVLIKTLALPSKRKSGKTIRSEGRCIIANVIKYFEDEVFLPEPLFPKSRPMERAAAAVGVSLSTVKRIRTNEDPEHPTPGKSRPRDTVVQLNDFEKCLLRCTIHEYYSVHKQVPNLTVLMKYMKEKVNYIGSISSLRRSLVAIGFKWKRSAVKGKVLVEKGDIIVKRSHYLRTIRRYRAEKRNIVFIDETWVSTNMKIGKCWQNEEDLGMVLAKNGGERIVFIHAGGEQGFVPGAQLHFRSNSHHGVYHGEMTSDLFVKWLTEKLLPNLPQSSVIIMDNAPYHSVVTNKKPNCSTKKQQIQDWLTSRGILFGDDFRIPELLQLVKKHKECVRYEVDEKVSQHGHIVLRLPPYHWDLNPLEYVWNEVKHGNNAQKSSNTIIDLLDSTKKVFETALQNWNSYCQQVKQLENEYWHRDDVIDELQDSVMNIDSDNSDSESSSSN